MRKIRKKEKENLKKNSKLLEEASHGNIKFNEETSNIHEDDNNKHENNLDQDNQNDQNLIQDNQNDQSLIQNDQNLNQNSNQEEKDLDFFNNSSPKLFLAKIASLEDSTSFLISLIKNISISKTDKLIKYFLKLSNFDISEISNLTLNKNRLFRQISTRFVYKFIISRYKDNDTNKINDLFKNVFLKRYKDIDPIIRSHSYEFLVDFISLNIKMFNKHKSLLIKALNDKQDIVRKSIISSMRHKRLFINEECLINLSKFDRNKNIRIETIKLICEFIKEDKIRPEVIFDILKCNSGTDKLENKDLNKFLKDLFINLLKINKFETIHKFIEFCSDYFDILDVEYFECDCEINCYFKIIEKQKKSFKLTDLYYFYKNNINSLKSIMGLLIYSEIDNTEIFIKFIDEIILVLEKSKDSEKIFEKICEFFKKIEEDYKSIIENYIHKLIYNNLIDRSNNIIDDKKYFKNIIIKYFDIKEHVTDEDFLETQIYKNLWNIINEDYEKILRFNNKKYDIFNKKDLCNILLYLHSQISDTINSLEESTCLDKKTGLKILYLDLLDKINLDDSDLLDFLYKFNEEKILEDQIYLIYKYIKNEEDFLNLFSVSKNKSNLVKSFFKFLSIFDYKDFPVILKISKIINMKFKDTEQRLIFNNLKYLVGENEIPCLEVFINKLNINECIVLENMCKEGCIKDVLNKKINKCKIFKSTEENTVTYL
ncbi:cohesin subunit [Vairimorpha necatrix]|uniref:Cohesin subunit n=1 Tax=Vairimorpha necatrix TaxID=6039 RepID=A0AAX4JDF4_9MICR